VIWPLLLLTAQAADWPQWGGDPERNMVAHEKKVPKRFDVGELLPGTQEVDPDSTQGVRWVVRLGSQAYGNPTIQGGHLYVGTNNASELRPGLSGDRSVLLSLNEATGALEWQLTVPKLGSGKVNDWEYLGICSSAAAGGTAVYVVSNRGEVVALDPMGLTNGNDGMQDELSFMAARPGESITLDPSVDADILWSYNMPEQLGVFPHNVTSSSVLLQGDRLYVNTSNGVDWSHLDVPSPFSPALIALDKASGALLAEEMSGVGERTLHGSWSSPAFTTQNDTSTLLFGAADGWLYSFTDTFVEQEGLPTFEERWRQDVNPPAYRTHHGEPVRYNTPQGPSEVIATPVVHEGVAYVAIGQDPEHGPGSGNLMAVRISDGTVLWTQQALARSISTVAVAKGIVIASDYDGQVLALNASTGEILWDHDLHAHVWGSPYIAGNQVYLGDEDGILTVFKLSKKKKVLATHRFPAPIYSTPVLANGTLYVATQTHLYAIDGK